MAIWMESLYSIVVYYIALVLVLVLVTFDYTYHALLLLKEHGGFVKVFF